MTLRNEIAQVIRAAEMESATNTPEDLADAIIEAGIVTEPLRRVADEVQLHTRINTWAVEKFGTTGMAGVVADLLFRARHVFFNQPEQS